MINYASGRTENVWCRATPELKERLAQIKAESGLSAADVLEFGAYYLSRDPVALADWLKRQTEQYLADERAA